MFHFFGSSAHCNVLRIETISISVCGHCATVKPAFSKLATTLKTDKNFTARAIAVDAAENPKVADMASVELLPTFKIYAAGKQLALYEGDRSYDDMLAFCKTHEKKVKDEL